MTPQQLAHPDELYEAPKLAILAVLDMALQQTLYSLFAAHPELVDGDTLADHWASGPDLWAADAVYDQVTSLQQALDRYRQALKAQTARAQAPHRVF
jgi:hypothetical protein